jgi:N-acetylglucosaminyldiphosphoundecaprenol N-acetyl-beta-D-mannosaminyltransferase
MSALTQAYRLRHKVLGYPVDLIDEITALSIIEQAWSSKRCLQIVTLNAEMVIASQNDQALDRIVRHAHLIIPDGAGVVWALRLAGHDVKRLPGIELAEAALAQAAKLGKKVALIGGKPELMEKLKTSLVETYPNLNIVAAKDGYFSAGEEPAIVDDLAFAEPDLLLIALGVPKQEYFIDRWHSAFPSAVMVGVGGSFDVWTGSVRRAPLFFRSAHLEWLYRLISQPWRYKRMGSALPSFALQVFLDRFNKEVRKSSAHGEKRSSSRIGKGHDKSKERSKDR